LKSRVSRLAFLTSLPPLRKSQPSPSRWPRRRGASLSHSAAGGEARTLELARTSWAATSGLDVDSEEDEEVAACHTLECGMTWAHRAFDELILPTTSVSFLVKDSFLIP
jgi:hypothetical protein